MSKREAFEKWLKDYEDKTDPPWRANPDPWTVWQAALATDALDQRTLEAAEKVALDYGDCNYGCNEAIAYEIRALAQTAPADGQELGCVACFERQCDGVNCVEPPTPQADKREVEVALPDSMPEHEQWHLRSIIDAAWNRDRNALAVALMSRPATREEIAISAQPTPGAVDEYALQLLEVARCPNDGCVDGGYMLNGEPTECEWCFRRGQALEPLRALRAKEKR